MYKGAKAELRTQCISAHNTPDIYMEIWKVSNELDTNDLLNIYLIQELRSRTPVFYIGLLFQ